MRCTLPTAQRSSIITPRKTRFRPRPERSRTYCALKHREPAVIARGTPVTPAVRSPRARKHRGHRSGGHLPVCDRKIASGRRDPLENQFSVPLRSTYLTQMRLHRQKARGPVNPQLAAEMKLPRLEPNTTFALAGYKIFYFLPIRLPPRNVRITSGGQTTYSDANDLAFQKCQNLSTRLRNHPTSL